jgi:hypothetical protein
MANFYRHLTPSYPSSNAGRELKLKRTDARTARIGKLPRKIFLAIWRAKTPKRDCSMSNAYAIRRARTKLVMRRHERERTSSAPWRIRIALARAGHQYPFHYRGRLLPF